MVYGFSTEGEYDPSLTFGLDVQALAAAKGAAGDAIAFRWGYLSPELDFFAATANGAARLRQELRKAQERLARKIVDDLVIERAGSRVPGRYEGYLDQPEFVPDPLPRGVAMRLPLEKELINVPEARLSN